MEDSYVDVDRSNSIFLDREGQTEQKERGLHNPAHGLWFLRVPDNLSSSRENRHLEESYTLRVRRVRPGSHIQGLHTDLYRPVHFHLRPLRLRADLQPRGWRASQKFLDSRSAKDHSHEVCRDE